MLERYPQVRLVVPHCGSFLPYMKQRAKAMFAMLAGMQQFYYDFAGAPLPEAMDMLLRITDVSHLLYGSDFPYVPAKVLLGKKTGLDEELAHREWLDKIYCQNSQELINLNADLYEIRPEVPYSQEDLNYNDESTRATVEQKNDSARPKLADKNAPIANYDTIVLAYPIWWGQAPRIMDTFVESYDFTGKKLTAVCTSGGSDIGTSADYLQKLTKGKAEWKSGKLFSSQAKAEDIKSWFNGLGL